MADVQGCPNVTDVLLVVVLYKPRIAWRDICLPHPKNLLFDYSTSWPELEAH